MPTKPATHPSDLCINFSPDNYDLGDDADDIERVHAVIDRANERIEALAAEVMAFRGTFGWAIMMARDGHAVRHIEWAEAELYMTFDGRRFRFNYGDNDEPSDDLFTLWSTEQFTGWTLSDGTLGPEVGT